MIKENILALIGQKLAKAMDLSDTCLMSPTISSFIETLIYFLILLGDNISQRYQLHEVVNCQSSFQQLDELLHLHFYGSTLYLGLQA